MYHPGDWSNEELLARLRAHVGKGQRWLAQLLVYLGEVDRRRLYAEHACSSMWDFCVRKLGMSDGEAHRRITVARIVQSFPRASAFLDRGDVHLCALYELRHHLSEQNHEELLREASGMSTRAVQEMIAARFPKPDVPPRVDVIGEQATLSLANGAVHARSATANGPSISAVGHPAVPSPRAAVAPLSATRYRVELTISAEMKAKLDRVRDLMRHRNPTGDLETIVGVSLELLLAKLEKERLGKTSRPRRSTTAATPRPSQRVPPMESPASDEGGTRADTVNALETPAVESDASAHTAMASADGRATDVTKPPEAPGRPATANAMMPSASATDALASNVATGRDRARRYISRETRRAVFARDGEQCTYFDAEGHRCPARGFLELDHVHAAALGGSDAPANLRVRCRAHNQHHAEQTFGRDYIAERIHLQRRKYDAPRSGAFDAADGALRSLGFRPPEVRRALATLQAKADAAVMPVETLLCEALRLLT